MLFEDVKVLFRVKRVTASDAELAIHLTKPITRTFGFSSFTGLHHLEHIYTFTNEELNLNIFYIIF